MAKANLLGQRFGKLLVIKEIPKEERPQKTANRGVHWLCQCDCGNQVIHYSGALLAGDINTCGCTKGEARKMDISGDTYGRLKVIMPAPYEKGKERPQFLCECECGNIVIVSLNNLRTGHKTSCGCMRSKGEDAIAKFLKEHNIDFTTEYTFKDLKRKGLLRFDFAIFKQQKLFCLIEYQGIQHYKDFGDFGKSCKETDILKKQYCEQNNIPLYEIKYNELVDKRLNEIFYQKKE